MISGIYKFIPIEDIESYSCGGKRLKHGCHITFDDGDRTIYENAYPVLKEMNIPASLFVSPKVIMNESNYWFQEVEYLSHRGQDAFIREKVSERMGCHRSQLKKYRVSSLLKCMKLKDILQVIRAVKKKRKIRVKMRCNMTKHELMELRDSGIFAVGCHTLGHPILSNESDDTAEREIRESVDALSKLMNQEIRYFAYPNGITGLDYGPRERTILKKSKIKLAFSVDYATSFNEKKDPLDIPRHPISEGKPESVFAQAVLAPLWAALNGVSLWLQEGVEERTEIKRMLRWP